MSAIALKDPAATLGSLARGRDNNFNLLRFLAASAVLASHSFALATGSSDNEPLRQLLGTTPGIIAVDVFFLTSGFLVSASLVRRQSLVAFAIARMLRIYPALLVAVSLTVLVVGLKFTTLPAAEFFASPQTWAYWARDITLVTNVAHVLPGAFEGTPWRHAVNASLWTLPYEMTMYLTLGLVWLAATTVWRKRPQGFEIAVVTIAAMALGVHVLWHDAIASSAVRLSAMFFAGSAVFVLRDRIRLGGPTFALLAVTVIASSLDARFFAYFYPLALPYLVLYLAYVPRGAVRRFNHMGDYSYGIYIYAWPVQQMTAALDPGVTPLRMFVSSYAVTLLLAVMSWHWIEKPALSRRPA